jgi:hypothetical protein
MSWPCSASARARYVASAPLEQRHRPGRLAGAHVQLGQRLVEPGLGRGVAEAGDRGLGVAHVDVVALAALVVDAQRRDRQAGVGGIVAGTARRGAGVRERRGAVVEAAGRQ